MDRHARVKKQAPSLENDYPCLQSKERTYEAALSLPDIILRPNVLSNDLEAFVFLPQCHELTQRRYRDLTILPNHLKLATALLA